MWRNRGPVAKWTAPNTLFWGYKVRRKGEAIAAARTAFSRCQFDEAGLRVGRAAASGLPEGVAPEPGVWKDRPRHDEASHGADAFLTFACSNYSPPAALPSRKRSFGWAV